MKWFMIGCGALALVVVAAIAALAYIGTEGVPIHVQKGVELDEDTRAALREIGALDDGDRVVYLYSDGLLDPREGMYLTTERHVVLHVDTWDPPTVRIPYGDIADARLDRDESFFVDSTITIELFDGDAWYFPASSEHGVDVLMFEDLERRIAAAR